MGEGSLNYYMARHRARRYPVFGLFQKKSKQAEGAVQDILFWKPPQKFLDLSLYPFRNSGKNKLCHTLHKTKLCSVWHHFGNSRSAKTHGNSTWVFLEHSWKFHFFFNWPLEFLHAVSSEFFWNSLLRTVLSIRYFSGITSICHLVIDMWFDWENF